MQKKQSTLKKGFTLIELLVVVAIVALLTVALTFTIGSQRTKAEDVQMKTDLARLKVAFEDYYNDHNCYPPSDWFNGPEDASSASLQPYLNQMLYNKKTALPYILEKDMTGCGWFKIYTTLSNANDPEAVKLRTTDQGTGSTLGNYGVSSGNTFISIFFNPAVPSPTPTPTATPTPGNIYYCSGVSNCSSFDNTRFNCSPSYPDPNCTGSSSCANIGFCTPL